jgi:hypothetical protein
VKDGTRALLVLLALSLSIATEGCGGGGFQQVRGQDGPLNEGIPQARPSMECLPDADQPFDSFTDRFRQGHELATASFEMEPPAHPPDQEAINLTAWSEQVLGPWLRRRTHAVEEARRLLDEAAEESHRQRIMGGAIVGLMYEDVARVLRSIPAPAELDDEPEIQEIYQQILQSQARPFLEHARRAYYACARNAIRPNSMRQWSSFCQIRRDRLPERRRAPAAVGTSHTEVEVIRE